MKMTTFAIGILTAVLLAMPITGFAQGGPGQQQGPGGMGGQAGGGAGGMQGMQGMGGQAGGGAGGMQGMQGMGGQAGGAQKPADNGAAGGAPAQPKQ